MSLLGYIKHFQIRSCLRCGSFAVYNNPLCSACYFHLRCLYSFETLSERSSPVQTKYLFQWNPRESDSLSSLLLRLKKDHHSWNFYAEEFWACFQLNPNFEIKPDTLLIPVPSKTGKKDHAHSFCEALSDKSGLPMVAALKHPASAKAQKKKSKSERRHISFELAENISLERLKVSHVILVDDILTTGETALAARRALRPLSFEAWVLASRSLSCGNPLNLL